MTPIRLSFSITCCLSRADLFEEQLQVAIDQIERTGFI